MPIASSLRPLLVAAVAVLVAACGQITGAGDPDTAASVDGTVIPVSTLRERYDTAKTQPQVAQQLQADSDGTYAEQVKAQILSQLVLSEILQQWAEELDITATDAEVEQERKDLVAQLGGQKAFDQAVEQAGLTPAEVEDQLRQRVLQRKVAEEVGGDAEPSAEEIAKFYEENRDSRFGERARARHILVKDRAKAEAIKRQLEGGADFAKLAEAESTDSGSAAKGGDLGEFGRGQMVPEFEKAIFGADKGEIVGPVKTEFGFHVIEVLGKVPGKSLDQARDEIRQELAQGSEGEALQQALMERTKKVDVEVNPRFGTWDPAAGEVRPDTPLGETSEPAGSEQAPPTAPAEGTPPPAAPSEGQAPVPTEQATR